MSRIAAASALLFLTASCLPAQAPAAAPAPAADDAGLMSMIPPEAVLFIERRGHEAIRQAFQASNLGEMAADEAIKQFVQDSRVQFGKMIVRDMFKLADEEEVAKCQQTLHSLLKPFWYNPCAMFVVLDANSHRELGLGFICVTGKYAAEAKTALETLMKTGVAPAGKPGTRQAFTYKSGPVAWQGVAKAYTEFEISLSETQPAREQLSGKSVFMAHWMGHVLCVATSFRAADALSKQLSMTDKSSKGKADNESLKVVMKKTALKDWAFRWYADVDALLKLAKEHGGLPTRMGASLSAMGLDKIRGLGGTGGYADNVFTRFTYVDAPGTTQGILRVFKAGGSYKDALAMTPRSSTFSLAGQIDAGLVAKIVREVALCAAPGRYAEREMEMTSSGPVRRTEGASTQPVARLDEKTEKALKQVDILAEAVGGNAGFYVMDLQGFMGMMMSGGGPPVGFVLDLKDAAKAEKAVEELTKLLFDKKPGKDEDDVPAPKGPSEYRKVKIQQVHTMLRLAVLKDRMIVAMDDTAMKAGIDAAMDKRGGFAPGGKAEALVKLAGDGAAVFQMDLAAIAKLGWPILMQVAESPHAKDHFPFASLPGTDKLVEMLGPEVAVFQPDEGGLLLKSRGKIPFSTKVMLAYPAMGMLWVGF